MERILRPGRGAQKPRFSEREANPADHIQEQIGPEGQLNLTGKRIAQPTSGGGLKSSLRLLLRLALPHLSSELCNLDLHEQKQFCLHDRE